MGSRLTKSGYEDRPIPLPRTPLPAGKTLVLVILLLLFVGGTCRWRIPEITRLWVSETARDSVATTDMKNQDLMSHQDRLGNNGTEPAGLTKPDDGDDRVQKKGENIAHDRDAIKLNKLKNSALLW